LLWPIPMLSLFILDYMFIYICTQFFEVHCFFIETEEQKGLRLRAEKKVLIFCCSKPPTNANFENIISGLRRFRKNGSSQPAHTTPFTLLRILLNIICNSLMQRLGQLLSSHSPDKLWCNSQ
jgi:hypothetical protein